MDFLFQKPDLTIKVNFLYFSRTLLAKMPIEPSTPWETARPQLEKEPEFEAVSQEFERQRIYKEFMKGI